MDGGGSFIAFGDMEPEASKRCNNLATINFSHLSLRDAISYEYELQGRETRVKPIIW